LRERGIEVDETNYAKTGLDAATVKAIVNAAGGVARVLNTRHEIARTRGWADKPPPVAEFADAVAADVNLLRRPIYIAGKKVLVGYDKKNQDEWDELRS
jgi:arsenate reductase-like glutaredoxin family protein